jgi:hypothetical protein
MTMKLQLRAAMAVACMALVWCGEAPARMPDGQSVVPRFAKGLKGHTIDSVRDALDSWYAAHPDRLQRPVIKTIWFEMLVPGLQRSK